MLNLRNGTNPMNFLTNELKQNFNPGARNQDGQKVIKDSQDFKERFNRFKQGDIFNGPRSLS